MDLRHRQGLTLVELMVVVVIIGVLATLAVTQFGASRESALEKEAIANLKLIAAAEKIYRLELLAFTTGTGAADINSRLRLMLPTSSKWTYNVPQADGSSFCANATKTNPSKSFSINHTQEEPVSPSNCP